MSGMLYLVPTPIGNLGDLTPRAAEVLASVDFIAAEDTRVTVKLLNHLDLKKELISYHQHNQQERGELILARLIAGESCALCTDAGTPAVSDPGETLVAAAAERGITVVPLAGACAAITALSASGLPSGRFVFEGFLSVAKKSRKQRLDELKDERRTMIFYEAPHKLTATLDDLYCAFGERRVALARELTKLHEEIIRTTLSQARELYSTTPPRGEFVLVIEGAPETPPPEPPDPRELLSRLLENGASGSEACKLAAAQTGMSKNELYKIMLELKEQ